MAAEDLKSRSILISVFACDPLHGSENYVGWQWMLMLSKMFGNVVVLTRTHNLRFIDTSLVPENVQLICYDVPFCSSVTHKDRIIKPYYVVWQIFALIRLFFDGRWRKADLIQHVTYNVIDMPGFLWMLPRKTFVWGPVGGGQVPPGVMKRVYGKRGWRKERMRAALKWFARYNPAVRGAVARAALVLFANEDTARILKGLIRRQELLLETGIHLSTERQPAAAPEPDSSEPFRVLWLNYVERRKGFVLAADVVRAANAMSSRPIVLDVVGEGPALAEAKAYADEIGIASRIVFHGKVPFQAVNEKMAAAALLLFTSVQDTSGNVVIEALSAGTPVLALNHQGVSQILSKGGGLLVDVTTYEETVAAMAKGLLRFVEDRAFRDELAGQARICVQEHLTWDAKARKLEAIYRDIV